MRVIFIAEANVARQVFEHVRKIRVGGIRCAHHLDGPAQSIGCKSFVLSPGFKISTLVCKLLRGIQVIQIFGDDGLKERGDGNGIINARRDVADAKLKRWKERMRV